LLDLRVGTFLEEKESVGLSSVAAVQSLHGAVTNKPNTNPNPKIIKLVTGVEAHFQTPSKMASNAK